jgi:hypothetical protein
VPGAVPSLLLLTAAATAAFHTLIPDHWLPFVLVGRARGWSARTTAAVSGFSAVVHTFLSIALGLLALRLGQFGRRSSSGSSERTLARHLGVAYALWAGGRAVTSAWRRPAPRPEQKETGTRDPSERASHITPTARGSAPRREGRSRSLIVGLNPCVLLLPIMGTADQGAGAIALVTSAYSVTTIALMVGLSVAGVAGTRRLPVPAVARHMETASGILIALCGAVFLLIDR